MCDKPEEKSEEEEIVFGDINIDELIELPSPDCGECPLCGAKLVPPDGGGPAYCPEGCQIC